MFYIFDSGVGGICVLNEMQKRFPKTDFTYICDAKGVRYGNLTTEQLKQKLEMVLKIPKPNDQIFIACNTLTAVYHKQNFKFNNVYTMFDLYDQIENCNKHTLLQQLIHRKVRFIKINTIFQKVLMAKI